MPSEMGSRSDIASNMNVDKGSVELNPGTRIAADACFKACWRTGLIQLVTSGRSRTRYRIEFAGDFYAQREFNEVRLDRRRPAKALRQVERGASACVQGDYSLRRQFRFRAGAKKCDVAVAWIKCSADVCRHSIRNNSGDFPRDLVPRRAAGDLLAEIS